MCRLNRRNLRGNLYEASLYGTPLHEAGCQPPMFGSVNGFPDVGHRDVG